MAFDGVPQPGGT